MAAGRKRKAGVKRINGRISRRGSDRQVQRQREERDVMFVARDARERVHGVSHSESGTELAGSFIGRLLLTREITKRQFIAAQILIDEYARFQRAMDSPPPPRAVNIGGISRGAPPDMHADICKETIAKWEETVRIIHVANASDRGSTLYAALYYCVLRDEQHMHLLGDMRLGLNALARHYRIAEARAA